MWNPVIWLCYPNRPDVELRWSWHLAFAHIFVAEIFKYILQVLHKWKCNKIKTLYGILAAALDCNNVLMMLRVYIFA